MLPAAMIQSYMLKIFTVRCYAERNIATASRLSVTVS